MKEKRDKAVKKCFAYMQKNASHNFSVAGTFDKAVKKVFVEGEAFFLEKNSFAYMLDWSVIHLSTKQIN